MKNPVAARSGRPAPPNNKLTAVILLSIALAFFAGVIAKHWLLSGG